MPMLICSVCSRQGYGDIEGLADNGWLPEVYYPSSERSESPVCPDHRVVLAEDGEYEFALVEET